MGFNHNTNDQSGKHFQHYTHLFIRIELQCLSERHIEEFGAKQLEDVDHERLLDGDDVILRHTEAVRVAGGAGIPRVDAR